MLAPKKVKWRKMQKGRRGGTAWRGRSLAVGDFGLQTLHRARATAAPDIWVGVVKPGRMLFEMEGVEPTAAREALKLAAAKLSVMTQIRERRAPEATRSHG